MVTRGLDCFASARNDGVARPGDVANAHVKTKKSFCALFSKSAAFFCLSSKEGFYPQISQINADFG
jgi:hypothetical protein